MLDGTDGSGQTFEQRVNSSTADIIYCNHAMNDMQSNGDLTQFEKNVITAIEICVNAGKLFIYRTPNAVTLYPGHPKYESNSLKIQWFSDVINKVCANYQIPVVDNNYYFRKTLMRIPQSDVLADGVHPTDLMYEQIGFNLTIPLVKCNTLKVDGDAQPTTGCDVFAGPLRSHEIWSSSKFGSVIYADGSISDLKKISIPFIYDSDCDIQAVVPMSSSGALSVSMVYQSSYDQGVSHTQLPIVPATLVSNVLTVMEGGKIPCGMTVLTFYINNVGAKVGLEGVVLRKQIANTVPIVSFENGSGIIVRDLVIDSSIYTTTLSARGIIGVNCGISLMNVINKDMVTYQSPIIFGLNASGYPQVGLLKSSGSYDFSVLNTTNYSASMHDYGIAITKGVSGSAVFYVDGASIGAVGLTNSFVAGFVGFYTSPSSSIYLYGTSVIGRK